jgi:glycerol uptake facilitator protein
MCSAKRRVAASAAGSFHRGRPARCTPRTVTTAASRPSRKVNVDNLGIVFLAELVGTAMLVLLGCGVVANVALAKNKGHNGGFLMVNFGWGLAVFAGVIVSYASGAHLNPAVTLGLVANGATEFGSGVPVNLVSVLTYIGAQMLGAFLGAVLVWLAYKQHFDAEPEAANKLGVFSTGPAIRSYGWNLVTEIIATFVLVFVVIGFGRQGDASGLAALGALPVALLVIGIGASLGGPTGYAINPARDLGPRIAHAVLPIAGKGASDWGYSWVPVVGPIIGGVLAGFAAIPLLPLLG